MAALQELGLAEAKGRVGACGRVFRWPMGSGADGRGDTALAPGRLSPWQTSSRAGAVFLAARHLGLDLPSVAAGLGESLY